MNGLMIVNCHQIAIMMSMMKKKLKESKKIKKNKAI